MKQPLSLMARKFQNSGGKGWVQNPDYDYYAFRKEYYFLYGTLMDPSTLARVLQLPSRPLLYPAKIVGYGGKL